ncbi:MAG: NAD-dependent epimerase/dehydratase family protein [Gammaproteobacteria bacterium]
MRLVLVTGAGGYIGSILTRMLLERGYGVRAVDRFFFGRETLPLEENGLQVIRADIRWLEAGWLQGVDAVIDLAALSNDPAGELEPEKTWDINHRGRVRIAHLAKESKVSRYILPSSCSVYGFQSQMINEESAVNPLTTYAKANLQAEQDVLLLADSHFCVTVLRQATVYGLSPRMRFDLAINGMVWGFFRNRKIPLLRDGSQWRPFVHVKDTVRAMLSVLNAPRDLVNSQIFNVGTDQQNVQIMSLARAISEAIRIPFSYEWYGLPDHRSYRVSFRKIEEVLDFYAKHTISDGAAEVYEALQKGVVKPDDPRTITVQWYKHLLEVQQFLKEVELEGVLL